ncbi:MAG: serine hydroxymethyltransferase [Legionella sp.]|nr:serine hydroxymethyltransferase [Legionella sp.]
MFDYTDTIATFDDALWQAMDAERQRQEDHIELIASENYVTPRVLEAQGSQLTNKYAEGYPGKRYYGGCEHVDRIEELAIERAKKLFSADFVNVQPHSGSQANAAVMMALLNPGDKILGMALPHGGHLTHGSPVNFSGKLYEVASYGVDEQTGLIDYAALEKQVLDYQPKLIIAGFSAYSQVVDWARFRELADKVGAYLLADMAHVAGLVAADLYPSPVPYADVVTSTTHKTLRGPRGGIILGKANEAIEKKIKSAVFPGTQGGPLMHVIAAKAVAFEEALQPSFKDYQVQVLRNAKVMARVLQERGYPILSGGTNNHLVMVNLMDKSITGKEAEEALGRAHLTVNKNSVPNDKRSPFVTSGLRLGTPAVTTRGFGEAEVEKLTHWMADILDDVHDEETITQTRERVLTLCREFPVYR